MFCLTCVLWGFSLVAAAAIVFKLYFKLTTGLCRSNVCLIGKTVIVTGANAGIGYEAAEDFAKRGAKVILACRDVNRGKDAEERIIKASDNKNVVFKQLDLSSLKSVRKFAQDVNKSEERLDILLNNAGGVFLNPEITEDGLLLVMATNYFGHFLLTNLLLDLIKKTGNSRIVNVSSTTAKRKLPIDLSNLNHFPDREHLPMMAAYSRTKLCNILFTIELAERLKGTSVTTYSLHPGIVASDIFRTLPPIIQAIKPYSQWFLKDNLEGAQTSIYCSVAKEIEYLSGEHFHDCHVVPRYKTAEDPNLPKKLWEVSCELVKLNQKQD